MDVQQFAQINQLKARQSQARSESSNQHCDHGFACLAKALQTPSLAQQKSLLLEACDAFAEAIRFQRVNPECYVGFAFVLLAIGNHGKAMRYVKEAQRLKPDHPDIKPLLDELQSKAAAKPTAPPPSQPGQAMPTKTLRPSVPGQPGQLPRTTQAIDYDALYDKTEQAISTEVKRCMVGLTVKPIPAASSKHIEQLTQQCEQLKERTVHFKAQLKIIDEEIDISELELKLKPLEQSLKRFETALEVSIALRALCREIQAQDQLAQQILTEAKKSTDPEDIPIVEENVEVLLDQADLFADRLDALEAKGHPVGDGVKVYNQLTQSIEELQEVLEDLKT